MTVTILGIDIGVVMRKWRRKFLGLTNGIALFELARIRENEVTVTPVRDNERDSMLDIVRGVALFGVLWVNLFTDFRISLFEHLFVFHTHEGFLNQWIDFVTAWLIEFKAFTVFSFLFGIGIGIQTERMEMRKTFVAGFLLRRFTILLGIGLVHMFLIWNGDILCLYAVCGTLSIPFLRMRSRYQVVMGVVAMGLTFSGIFSGFIPTESAMRNHAAESTSIYANGSFTEILRLRWSEAWEFIIPLLINALPKTFGLNLLGVAAWRSGVLKSPVEHRYFLTTFSIVATTIGALATSLIFWSVMTETAIPISQALVDGFSYIPLALGLTSGLILWLSYERNGYLVGFFAAPGQMALTNYLCQSLIFSAIFYGYGLQLFGKLAPAPTAVIGFSVFAVQIVSSRFWLHYFCFGPVEWIWRSLSYSRWQLIRRPNASITR